MRAMAAGPPPASAWSRSSSMTASCSSMSVRFLQNVSLDGSSADRNGGASNACIGPRHYGRFVERAYLGAVAVDLREHPEHDLVGPASDPSKPVVTQKTGGPGLFHVADAAVELEAPVGDL